MKTIKKIITLAFASCISALTFAQLGNLGVQSGTRAVLNPVLNTTVVSRSAVNTTLATKNAVNAANSKAALAKTKVSTRIKNKSNRAVHSAKKNTSTNTNVSASSQNKVNVKNHQSSVIASQTGLSSDNSVKVSSRTQHLNENKVIEKSESIAKKTSASAAATTKSVKVKTENHIKSDVNAAKAKTNTTISAKVKSETTAKAGVNH